MLKGDNPDLDGRNLLPHDFYFQFPVTAETSMPEDSQNRTVQTLIGIATIELLLILFLVTRMRRRRRREA